MHAPVDNLLSNGAYMLMTSLAWNLKAWLALSLPAEPGRWHEQHQAQKQQLLGLEFRTFVNYFLRVPAQVVKTGRRLVRAAVGVEHLAAGVLPAGRPVHSSLQLPATAVLTVRRGGVVRPTPNGPLGNRSSDAPVRRHAFPGKQSHLETLTSSNFPTPPPHAPIPARPATRKHRTNTLLRTLV